jgi:5-methylthioadenosine/S-adenosylhomocysteine deaminase
MATVVASSSLRADDIGSIEPGKRGDIITLDTQNPRLFPTNEENAISNVVYSADSSCVSDVMVNGDFRKRSGILLAMPYRDWKREELV